MKNVASFLAFCLLSTLLAQVVGISPLFAFAVLALLLFATAKGRIAKDNLQMNAVEVSRWVDYILQRFWKDNSFLQHWYSDDEYVEGGKTVVIPQPGSKPAVNKNNTTWPLTAAQRTDTTVSYDLAHYITDPSQVTNAEQAEISYDKMDSILGDHVGVLNDRAAEELLITVLDGTPSANIVYTTGGGGDNPVIINAATEGQTGQTGNRYGFHHKDLKNAGKLLDKQNIPKADRYALLDADSLKQMTDSMTDSQFNAFNQYYNESTGVVGKLYGFTILSRSLVAVAAAALDAGTLDVNAYGASVGATNVLVNLCWHKNALARAMGEINVMHNPQRVEFGGDIMNAEVRFGGRRRYSTAEGMVAIVQDTAS